MNFPNLLTNPNVFCLLLGIFSNINKDFIYHSIVFGFPNRNNSVTNILLSNAAKRFKFWSQNVI